MVEPYLPRRLARFTEVTSGTGPADAAAWAASGQPQRVLADTLDPSPLVQAMIDDTRSQTTVLGEENMILGIKGGGELAVSWDTFFHGSGDTSRADADTQATNDLIDLFEHSMGAVRRATTHTLAGGSHTASVVNFDDVTDVAIGDWYGFVRADGLMEKRQVLSISTLAVTLAWPLSFVPEDADLAIGLTHAYISETQLVDSAVGGTYSYLMEFGLAGSTRSYEMRGCVTHPTAIGLERGSASTVSWETLVASFDTPETAPTPDWSGVSAAGDAGQAIGPDTVVRFADRGAVTAGGVHAPSLAISPGLARKPIMTITEQIAGMPGLAAYGLAKGSCTMELAIVPSVDAYEINFNARTRKTLTYERLGPVGSGFSFHFPTVEITGTPVMSDTDESQSTQLALKAHTDVFTSGGQARNSRMMVVFG